VQYTTGREYGLVAYVHGRGIDVPLGIARSAYSPGGSFLLVPYLDWRGQWELGTDEDGERYPACGADPNCVRIGWPSTAVRSYLERLGAEGEGDWVGSILRDQRDPSGFLYRRNRYYDPMAGRFTQPDPIGLAGGINLYGFAGGDPANFSDPFGLQHCDPPPQAGEVCEPEDPRAIEEEGPSPGSSEWYAARIATGEGNRLLNELGGVLATVYEELTYDYCEDTGACVSGVAPDVSPVGGVPKGLVTGRRFFGSRTAREAIDALARKFGPARYAGEGATSFFNPRTGRSFHVHTDPLHGAPHVDVRRRGPYEDFKFWLRIY